ncbi:MAG: transglutaminase domain-containing protein [Oscillospiraceae bacterium]|nr:transglutaminase domain-containing protein [Oscillospiraceae bacterium]
MKKRLSAFFIMILFLFSNYVVAEASSATYRSQLGRTECEIYDTLALYLPQGRDSFDGAFSQPLVYASADEASAGLQDRVVRAYEAFYRDHPEVFWIDKSGISFSPQYDTDGDSIYIRGFSLQVTFTASASLSASLEQAVNAILQGASGTDYDKMRYFHDAILAQCVYDSAAASSYDPMACEAYGALVEGSAICEGYAKAFKLLCNRAGIPCEIIGGTVGSEAHMWNYVSLGGVYYLVDATFDDAAGVGTYDYFLRGSSSVGDHIEEGSLLEGFSTGLSYPALSSTDYIPGAGDGNASTPPAAPTEEETPAGSAAETSSAAKEGPSELHPARVPQSEEGFFRISSLFSKNGRYWIKADGISGFLRGNQSLPAGSTLQIIAFPDPGYRVDTICITNGETELAIHNGSSFSFSPASNCQIQVFFEKEA